MASFKEQREALAKLEQLERRADKLRGKRGIVSLEPETVALLVVNGVDQPEMLAAVDEKTGIAVGTQLFVSMVDSILQDEESES